ncbi:MAG: type II toxin-antitoxin system HicB family antitoxin [Saccharofermentans sp.]|nr:type II toxin-antitoxin system HicB family antitoxin [Saccharofermentans sp.]
MKSLDEYMELPYPMLFRPGSNGRGFLVSFPDLPGCISIGDTIEEAYANAQEAKQAWLERAIAAGVCISEPDSN